MTINFSTNPYFDDYDESKNFQRILFKPGFAVQARELNQLQTILQNQVSRFGKHIFKDGSQVIPGNSFVDRNFNFVKLQPQFASVDINVNNFLNRFLVGQTSGVRAKVIKVEPATNTDPPTLFVKYVDSGNDRTTGSFLSGETIATFDTGPSFSASVGTSTPTGKCIAVVINEGVYFTKETFVRVGLQTLILDKYSDQSTYKVGLNISEDIVDSNEDSSLLDPAVGTFNFFAPGADRYKIALTLAKRGIDEITTSDTFIELLRVENGFLVDFTRQPGYSVLADELARRTFDESGDYTVNPFKLSFIEHLRDNTNPSGYFTSTQGGNASLAVAVVNPGKAYVRGYEVETIANKYLIFEKPRDTTFVENAIIRTPFGNYVNVNNNFSIPNFTSDLIKLNLYNRFTSVKGVPSGTLVGNARVRGIEVDSGNVMFDSSSFKLFIFDTEMRPGFTFERDVKQVFHASVSDSGYTSNTYSADIITSDTSIRGAVSLVINSNSVVGVNTFFNNDLKVGDYIRFTSDTPNVYRVETITSNTTLNVLTNYPLANVSGVTVSRQESVINDRNLSSYIFPFPNTAIDNLSDITTRTRRVSFGTLAAGNIDLTTAVNTTFASLGTGNYYAVTVTGDSGKLYQINSGNFEFSDSPTNRNIRIKLGAGGSPDYGLTNEDVLIYSTVIKSNPLQKTKTETSGSITYTARVDCQLPVIPLGHADVFEISNVQMSANAFGTAFSSSNAIDITNNYDLDTGQTSTFYNISKLVLKPSAFLPSGPIRVNYKFYSHGAGDYFSAESYPSYEKIPTFVDQGVTYNLRDSLDFRPRISNDGVNFKNTGASRNEFLDYSNDFQTDYNFYLPRTDKIFINSSGDMVYQQGISSLNPVEPLTPTNSMPLYVIELPAYLFDTAADPVVTPVDQKRYTMRDIGKIETRVRNLEYYTTLSLLELDTAIFSIKDRFGLDRFKNGFIVDNFRTHGIGDVRNPEHNISMDFVKGELIPPHNQLSIKISEENDNDAQRLANGYKLVSNNFAMLNFIDEEYISIDVASDSESITPYDNYVFTGSMELTPPGDVWFDETDKPLVYKNDRGEYDVLIPDAVGEKTYGSIWESWKQFWYQADNTDTYESTSTGVVVTNAQTFSDAKTVVLPFARSATINFKATNLKPNTKYFAFFSEYNVTQYCQAKSNVNEANIVFGFDLTGPTKSNIFSNSLGVAEGTFNFNTSLSGLRIPTGLINFRLTDSPTNSTSKESFADAVFNANGTLVRRETKKLNQTPTTGQNQIGSITPSATTTGGVVVTTSFSDLLTAYVLGGTINVQQARSNSQFNALSQQVKNSLSSELSSKGISESEFVTGGSLSVQTLLNNGLNMDNVANGQLLGVDWNSIGLNGTNILNLSTTVGGQTRTFLNDARAHVIAAAGGDSRAWSGVEATYNSTVAAVTAQVNAAAASGYTSGLSASQVSFWNGGGYAAAYSAAVASGGSAAGQAVINSAIASYSAQTTLGAYTASSGTSAKASYSSY